VKLNTELFNSILEQVKRHGPDEDCRVEIDTKTGAISGANEVFIKYIALQYELILNNPTAAIATNFQLAFEAGMQYAKVSREVKQLDKLLKGESPE
jgi:hypothetical protein